MIKNLGKNQLTLNKQLDSNNKNIFDNEDEEEKRNIQMKKDLFRAQLESQAKEIDILKTEINLYKKKGGHIYTKVTTNRRVAHLNDNWSGCRESEWMGKEAGPTNTRLARYNQLYEKLS